MDVEEGNTWVWATPTTIPLEEAMGGDSLLTMVYPPPADGVDLSSAFTGEDGKTSEEVRRELLGALSSWPSEEVPPSNFPLPMESEGSIQP